MSRQARKEAAAAARDLLKIDAARVRKGGAAPMRKAAGAPMPNDAAAAMRKDGAAGAPRKDAAAAMRNVPVRATPPRSFTDGSCFFNDGSADDLFSCPVQSSQPWNHLSSDPAMWGTNATPPGGFTHLIQPNMSQNFNFGGEPSHYAPFRPPRSMQEAQSEDEFSTPILAKDNNSYVNIESSGEDAPRTEKRIYWSQEEDVRMMSS